MLHLAWNLVAYWRGCPIAGCRLRRDELQLLAAVLAHLDQQCAILWADALVFWNLVVDIDAWQLDGKARATTALTLHCNRSNRGVISQLT